MGGSSGSPAGTTTGSPTTTPTGTGSIAGTTPGSGAPTGTLAQNTMGAFGDALGGARDMANFNTGVGNMNLQPYMNPFTQDVTNTTMNEMNRQEGLQNNNIQDAAQRAGAFGGDRMSVQMAENNRNYDAQRASTLAGLNSNNFLNAQNVAGQDLSRGLGARQFGINNLFNGANMGFGFGQSLDSRLAGAGATQQATNQQILDSIQNAFKGWAGAGDTGLARYTGAIQDPHSYGTQTSNTQPGIMGLLGGIGSMIAPFL
jgi:hypothetical protein